MGVHIRAVFLALAVCLCVVVAGCAKPRAQAAVPPLPPPEPLPLHDRVTGETCGTPSNKPEPGITPPKAIYTPEPEYTEAARKAKLIGTVYMVIDVGSDGLVKNVCLAQSLTKDLDKQAMKAVRTWKFWPASKDGMAIAYTMTATVSFNLY